MDEDGRWVLSTYAMCHNMAPRGKAKTALRHPSSCDVLDVDVCSGCSSVQMFFELRTKG
jgi:hypothetical protein